MQHCNNYDLLPSYQSAYRKFHGCETSLVKLVNDLLWAMEHQQVSSAVILDLSATFDTTDQELLLQVLHNKFGISGSALKWYTTYIRPRRFRVCINGHYSSEQTMHFSVSQGSTQGAFLFSAYASPIKEMIPNSLQLNAHVDDHSLRKSFNPDIILGPTNNTHVDDETGTIVIIEGTMLKVKTWMDAVHLKLNESET